MRARWSSRARAARRSTERRLAYMRYVGQGHEITVPLPVRDLTADDAATLRETFEREYSVLFRRPIPGAAIEALSWSVLISTQAQRPAAHAPARSSARRRRTAAAPSSTAAPAHRRRAALPARAHGGGRAVRGPAIIAEDETSTFVTASFDARIDAAGCIVMERRV